MQSWTEQPPGKSYESLSPLFQPGHLLLPLQVDKQGTSGPTVILDEWRFLSPRKVEQEETGQEGSCEEPAPGSVLPGTQGASQPRISAPPRQDGAVPRTDDRCDTRRLFHHSQGKRMPCLETVILLNKSLLCFLGESLDIYLKEGYGFSRIAYSSVLPWQHPFHSRVSTVEFSVCFYNCCEPNIKIPFKAGSHPQS